MKRFIQCLVVMICLICAACSPHFGHCATSENVVTIIVPFGPGGAVDIAARILADFWKEKYGQETLILCRGGGSGAPAMLDFLRAKPDGHTLAFVADTGFATTGQLMPVGYTLNDVRTVGQVSMLWLSLAVHTRSSVHSVSDLLEKARTHKGHISFGTHGPLSLQRLFMSELLRKVAPDVDFPHVSFGSGHHVTEALLSGRIYAGFGVLANQKQAVEEGDLRLLAVSSPQRLEAYPQIPTFAELYGPQFVAGSGHGLITHAAASDVQVRLMEERLTAALADPAVQSRFARADIDITHLNAADYQEQLKQIWDKIAAKIQEGDL